MDLAQSRQPFAVPDDSGDEDDTPKVIEAEGATDISPQAQRRRVNRMLKLMQQKATMYELLDVKADANDRDINAAWKKTVGGIHPDKNKDNAAHECTQAANAAKDVLLDPEKRKIYNNFIKTTPPPPKVETFDEDFAQGAFDHGSDDDAIEEDEEDSEEDDEANYPLPTKQVVKLHKMATPCIKAFFEDVEGGIKFSLLNAVDKINDQIQKDNINYRRTVLSMYQVPRQKLLLFQYAQRRILMSFETKIYDFARVQKETSWLLEHFTKTRQRGLYSWPAAWTQLLMEPLHRKLEILGMFREQQMLPDMENATALLDDDVEMEDVEEEESPRYPNTGRPIQPLRPGFTITGDPILGYSPVQRWSKAIEGERVLVDFKFFVKVDGVNPIKIASGDKVGSTAALAYHHLPEQKKNNVKENAAKYATMEPTNFVEIIGVAWVPGSAGTTSRRLPATYVWVKTLTSSNKPNIMTRTTLRQWLGTRLADQHLSSWFATRGITPEWTVSDPANNSRHLRLTYPLPRQSSNYNLRSRIQTGGLTPSGEDGQMEELGRRFDQLVDLLVRGQEEAREDRRLQREIMNRLLPAPDSGA
ncbi:hypothetical protein F4801DRAFT_381293 [Xylaria longipes]|nr:hypothetical protein F4801DRAFT_381293 [Xylaria longipes]